MKLRILLVIGLTIIAGLSAVVLPHSVAGDYIKVHLDDWENVGELQQFLNDTNIEESWVLTADEDGIIHFTDIEPIEKAVILAQEAEKIGRRLSIIPINAAMYYETIRDNNAEFGAMRLERLSSKQLYMMNGAFIKGNRYYREVYYLVDPRDDRLYRLAKRDSKIQGLWKEYFD